jgi:hypothetical protein
MMTYAFALTKAGNKLAIELGSFSKLRLDGRLSLENAMLSAVSRMRQESSIGFITFRCIDFRSGLYNADKIEGFPLEEFMKLKGDSFTRYGNFLVYKF